VANVVGRAVGAALRKKNDVGRKKKEVCGAPS
jgi:hypothetical protein